MANILIEGKYIYKICVENPSAETSRTINEVVQNPNGPEMQPGTFSEFYDKTSSKYAWLMTGWVAEERTVLSGRLYVYYYDPSGRLYNRKYKVLEEFNKRGYIVIDE